jgi:hypothetical protein
LRSATFAPAALMVRASAPLATMLPRAPGIAMIVSDLLIATVAVLKLAESSIQTSPPSFAAATGGRQQPAGSRDRAGVGVVAVGGDVGAEDARVRSGARQHRGARGQGQEQALCGGSHESLLVRRLLISPGGP